jgi:hypothetical protein
MGNDGREELEIVEVAHFVRRLLERDDVSSNRHLALSFCLSMISAQTRSAFVARENR